MELIISLLTGILSAILPVPYKTLRELFKKHQLLKDDAKRHELLANQIEELSASLRKSAELMGEIEIEFQRQKQQAEKWNEEAKTSKLIAAMSQEEVEAVSKLFGKQIDKSTKSSNRSALIWNIVFCIVGLIGGYLISRYLI